MTNLTIQLPEEQAQAIAQRADELGLQIDQLIRSALEGWLAASDDDFLAAKDKVMAKNAELYKRLA